MQMFSILNGPVKGGGAAIALGLLFSTSWVLDGHAAEIGGTIITSSYGGIDDKNATELFFDPFAKETGVEFSLDPVGRNVVAKLQAQAKSDNVQYSLLQVSRFNAASLRDEGLLAPLPQQLIDKANKVLSSGMLIGDFGIAHGVSASSFVCREEFKHCPKNAKEFFDVENFPGRRAIYADGWLENIIYALQADGVANDKLFPLDLDRAFKKLDELKEHVDVFWKTGDQSTQLIRDNEVDMAILWDGRANTLPGQGTPIQISSDGAVAGSVVWTVAAKGPNKDAAFAFIDWYMDQAEAQGEYMNRQPYGEPNPEAFKYVNPDIASKISTAPGNAEKLVQPDLEWVTQNQSATVARWTEWVQD